MVKVAGVQLICKSPEHGFGFKFDIKFLASLLFLFSYYPLFFLFDYAPGPMQMLCWPAWTEGRNNTEPDSDYPIVQ